MNIRPTAGLVAAGGVNLSFLARLRPAVMSISLIKGFSLRVSRRIANGFHHGSAVTEYAALSPCKVIWIYAPEELVAGLCRELASAISLTGKIIIICDTPLASIAFSQLLPGARLSTLNPVPGFNEKLFVCEGVESAVAQVRNLVEAARCKLIQIRPESKSIYLAGVLLSAHMLLPWFAASVESFRAAGLTRAEASHIAQHLGTSALRAYVRAGDRAWNPDTFQPLLRAVNADLSRLSPRDVRLVELVQRGAEHLLHFSAEKPVFAGRLSKHASAV